jgi:hypothetical protein
MGMVMKKTARNDVTGDWLQSKPNNEMFEKNWDLIFGKKKKVEYELDEGQLTEEQYAKIKELAEYELNKSTGEVQKVDNGDTTNT